MYKFKPLLTSKSYRLSSKRFVSELKDILKAKINLGGRRLLQVRKQYGMTQLAGLTVESLYSGLRAIPTLICETSEVDSSKGVHFRGYSWRSCRERLPRVEPGKQPMPEAMWWLLLTGEIPTLAQTQAVSKYWAENSEIPPHVENMVNMSLENLSPITQLSIALGACSSESKFSKGYDVGMRKPEIWEYIYEDANNIISKIPRLSALIYRNLYKERSQVPAPDSSKDWTWNFCNMLGYENEEFVDLTRMLLSMQCDHDAGSICTHVASLLSSGLTNPYLCYSGSLAAMEGPLQGSACAEAFKWVKIAQRKFGNKYNRDDLKEYVWSTLKSGCVIPGFGHGAFKSIDMRFLCEKRFAEKKISNDKLIKIATDLYNVVPGILKKLEKVANPYPNVHAFSGLLLNHYGMEEYKFYPVIFGVSRCLGVMAQIIWNRAMLMPTERPICVSTDKLISMKRMVIASDEKSDELISAKLSKEFVP